MPDATRRRPAPRPVIFDLDGTLWDSAPGIISCLVATLEHFGLAVPPDDQLLGHLGPPLVAMLSELGVAASDVDEARILYRRHYAEHGEFECTVFDGVTDLLDGLRARGHRLATATSKGHEATARMLDHFDLRRRFDVIAAASMTAVGHSKADVVAEAMAGLASLSANGSGWMIGDRRFDIEAGRRFGLTTVAVTWGYAPPGELDAARPDHVTHSFDELAALLDP